MKITVKAVLDREKVLNLVPLFLNVEYFLFYTKHQMLIIIIYLHRKY